MAQTLAILSFLTIVSCGYAANKFANNNTKNERTQMKLIPFELTVEDADYSMSQTFIYRISDNKIEIYLRSDVNLVGMRKGENIDTLYKLDLKNNTTLKKLSNINLDNLKEAYSNHCIIDGSQVTVKLYKGGKSKTVHLSNYYRPEIGYVIELLNNLIPQKYKIWYDKSTLLKGQENCK